MTSFLVITDQHSKIFGHRLLNSQLALYIGVIQLFVCIWSLTQHVFSILAFDKVSSATLYIETVQFAKNWSPNAQLVLATYALTSLH